MASPVKEALFDLVITEDGATKLSAPKCRLKDCAVCGCRLQARQPIPGRGNTQAAIAFIGQNPGFDEDKAAKVFVGDGGDELKRWLPLLGLDVNSVYLTHAVKCHTDVSHKLTAAEVNTCRDMWLVRELAMLPNLKVVVTLGKTAKEAVLGRSREEAGVTITEASRAVVKDALGRSIVVLPIPHPSYFFRARDDKPYFIRVVVPEVRAALVELGVARATD